MKLEIDFNEKEIEWEENSFFKIEQRNSSLVSIEANKEGLISLAKQLLALAYNEENLNIFHWAEKMTDKGYWYGNLEKGSVDLSIVKIETQGRRNCK